MKIKKTQLKQIVLEELQNTMNEMAIDEMAFSMDDVDAVSSDIDSHDAAHRALTADRTYTKLIAQFKELVNEMGGVYVVDPQQRIGEREKRMGIYDPYNRNLAVLYRVLVDEAEKLDSWSGHPPLQSNAKALMSKRDKDPIPRLQNYATNIIEKLEEIADYAEKQDDAPGVNSDEPFLSVSNASYIRDMAQTLRMEWASSNFNK